MNRRNLALILAGSLVILLYSSTYTVAEYEQAVLTQFGKIVGRRTVNTPGLHLKLPFVQEVHRFEKRWLEWDGSPNQIPTRDKKYIWVDAYARWRIADPAKFYQRLRDESGAQSRLDDIIDGEVRNVIASHDLIEVVRTTGRAFEKSEETDDSMSDEADTKIQKGRSKLTDLVLQKASAVMPDYGIELNDVQLKRLNYVDTVQQKVFERMISERKRIAERYRSEGQGKSAEIRGKLEREMKSIESEAYRRAQEIRGRGDAEATSVYASAYGRDPEFYKFTKTLETYRSTIDGDTVVVLSTDAEVLRYLKTER